MAKPSGDHTSVWRLCLTMTFGGFEMPPRLQKYLWLVVDHAVPEGPAFFLTFLVLLLLIVNVLILLLR